MRFLLFSSQILNILNYARALSDVDNEFIVTPLVPINRKKDYELMVSRFGIIESANIHVCPIFLKSPDERFRNLLNPNILLSDFRSIFKTLRSSSPDVVICAYILHAFPLIFLKRILNYKLFVIASGGDINLSEGTVYGLVRRFVYSQSELIFAVANNLKTKIRRESGYRAIVIPTGVDPSFFRPLNSKTDLRVKWGLEEGDFIVLTLCHLIERKCIDDVIKSIRILQDRKFHNTKLIIAGHGPERHALERLAFELKLKSDTTFLGFVNETEKLELFNLADVYVIPSYSEGLPFSLIEAMACGCVCLSTPVGDIPGVIFEGRNGFLISPRDPENLAKKIEKVVSLPRKQISFVQNQARRTVLDNFDFRKLTRHMIYIIVKKLHSLHRN